MWVSHAVLDICRFAAAQLQLGASQLVTEQFQVLLSSGWERKSITQFLGALLFIRWPETALTLPPFAVKAMTHGMSGLHEIKQKIKMPRLTGGDTQRTKLTPGAHHYLPVDSVYGRWGCRGFRSLFSYWKHYWRQNWTWNREINNPGFETYRFLCK